jgi:hypothetical protein
MISATPSSGEERVTNYRRTGDEADADFNRFENEWGDHEGVHVNYKTLKIWLAPSYL